jgi:hypothetical protein
LKIRPLIGKQSLGLYLLGALKFFGWELSFECAEKALDRLAKLRKAAPTLNRCAVTRFDIKGGVPGGTVSAIMLLH